MTTESILSNEGAAETGAETSGGGASTATAAEGSGAEPTGEESPAGGGGESTAGAEGGGDTPSGSETEGGEQGGEDEEGETSESDGAPEAYEDFTVPEGIDLPQEEVERFSSVARELNLTQEQAQRLVDLESERLQEMQQQQQQHWQQTVEQWAEQARNDGEIGGDNFDAAAARANRVLDAYGTPELREALTQTGLGNHPELVRVFAKLGNALSEDNLVTGGPDPAQSTDAASRLYPSG